MTDFWDRIEWLNRTAQDESLPAGQRIDAADEVLMWAGPEISRAAFRRHFSGPDGEERWAATIALLGLPLAEVKATWARLHA